MTAGDSTDAILWLRTDREEHPVIRLHARAGSYASYRPAAPAFIRDPLQVHLSGADAVGTVSYR